MKQTKKLTLAGVLIALSVVLSTFYIPFGTAKCFPIQHLINVITAVLLGPVYAVVNAFIISVLRNIMGLGSLLAFPGSMIGALLAGLMYRRFKNVIGAAIGEVIGTGIIGAIVAAPIAVYFLGSSVGALFFIIPFILSSFVGALIAVLIIKMSVIKNIIQKRSQMNND